MIEEIDLNEAEEAALEAAWARLDEKPVTECARCDGDCPHGRPLQECTTGANAGKPGPCPDEGEGESGGARQKQL